MNIVVPFIGNLELSGLLFFIFILCLLAVVGFEFVNGFHDTANAVATVIYTKALKPVIAIPWSGLWNFLGVFTGGIAVAMGILKLVPLDKLMSLPAEVGAYMVLSVLLASIAWNLGTWYIGIPCSSSHTMIGAMIGAGLAFTWYYGGSGVNWGKAEEIGISLVISPVIGFALAAGIMYLLRRLLSRSTLFHIPSGEHDRPPVLIRGMLIVTCTLVSFFHGSNDGQKGVGLFMLILIAFLPARYAVNLDIPDATILRELNRTEHVLYRASITDKDNGPAYQKLISEIEAGKSGLAKKNPSEKNQAYAFRRTIEEIVSSLKQIHKDPKYHPGHGALRLLDISSKNLLKITDFAPLWVIMVISLSLGLGTMIGWKRIVVTIGEKIGNEHLNYAQGATSEVVAASTIGLSTAFGLPVSTTHVLSSGIAGAMIASGGKGNLNNTTLKNIGIAWVLTLPVSIALAFGLFMLLHLLI